MPDERADHVDGRVVASAVVVPEASPSPPPRSPARSPDADARAGTKRRQSSVSHASPKRQRLSPSPDQSRKEDAIDQPPVRQPRPTKPVDEKKRSQRLFGALLGGLGQSRPANSAAAKRRAEQEERRRQKEQELSERQKERAGRLELSRKKEQRRVDEASMRIRHENMRAMANFLVTSAEPKLYFKPWELLPEQDDQINRQREEVDAQVDQELDDFDQVRQRWQNEDENEHADQQDGHARDTINGTTHGSEPAPKPALALEKDSVHAPEQVPEPGMSTTAGTEQDHESNDQSAEETERQRKDSIDDTGDIVVEADEDTVIY